MAELKVGPLPLVWLVMTASVFNRANAKLILAAIVNAPSSWTETRFNSVGPVGPTYENKLNVPRRLCQAPARPNKFRPQKERPSVNYRRAPWRNL
ncbi:hypothetical protein [Reinekea sp.]|uniref:hypothetical protein n=1 Tax=Reinekea sp. TaxID=1970455 RepID=UPI002A831C00|nr:hypothetical protein [Reinekea sp.]